MILIKQKNGIDCGLAVIAMCGNSSYEQAADVDPNPDACQGLSPDDLKWGLIGLTGQDWIIRRASLILRDARLKPHPQALLIRRDAKTFGHWVASDGKNIFDPERENPIPLTEYDRQDWSLIRIIAPR